MSESSLKISIEHTSSLRNFKLPPRGRWELRSFGLLRSERYTCILLITYAESYFNRVYLLVHYVTVNVPLMHKYGTYYIFLSNSINIPLVWVNFVSDIKTFGTYYKLHTVFFAHYSFDCKMCTFYGWWSLNQSRNSSPCTDHKV